MDGNVKFVHSQYSCILTSLVSIVLWMEDGGWEDDILYILDGGWEDEILYIQDGGWEDEIQILETCFGVTEEDLLLSYAQ